MEEYIPTPIEDDKITIDDINSIFFKWESYIPAPEPPKYVPSRLEHAGPKRLTIQEYKNRQLQQKEREATHIPKIEANFKHKKRGGRITRLRIRLGHLISIKKEEQEITSKTVIKKIEEEIKSIKDQLNKKTNTKKTWVNIKASNSNQIPSSSTPNNRKFKKIAACFPTTAKL